MHLLPLLLHAATLHLSLPSTPLLPTPSLLPPSTHATLSALSLPSPLTALLRRSNSFEFSNLTAGSYLLDIHSRDYTFAPYRVDVDVASVTGGGGGQEGRIEVWQTFRGNEWDNKGEKVGEGMGSCGVEVKVVGAKGFYEERGGCAYRPPPPLQHEERVGVC